MKNTIKKFGQLVIILILIGILVYVNQKNKNRIDAGVLFSSVYVDEKLNTSTQILKDLNVSLYESIIDDEQYDDTIKQSLKSIHSLIDVICNQTKELKNLAIEISGGMQEKDNFYTIHDMGYNFGHKNKLTGDKDENNGEGSKLKLNIEKLRQLEKQLIGDSKDVKFIEEFLNTSEKKENNSDYVFSWEEQYFKLLPTVGILNLLSIIENDVLNSERVVMVNILKKK